MSSSQPCLAEWRFTWQFWGLKPEGSGRFSVAAWWKGPLRLVQRKAIAWGLARTLRQAQRAFPSRQRKVRADRGNTWNYQVRNSTRSHSRKRTSLNQRCCWWFWRASAAVTEAAESSAECQPWQRPPQTPSKRHVPPTRRRDSLSGQSVSLAKETPEGPTEETTCGEGQLHIESTPRAANWYRSSGIHSHQALRGGRGLAVVGGCCKGRLRDWIEAPGSHQKSARVRELALPSREWGFQPGADESFAVSHKDSLEASPVLEDNSLTQNSRFSGTKSSEGIPLQWLSWKQPRWTKDEELEFSQVTFLFPQLLPRPSSSRKWPLCGPGCSETLAAVPRMTASSKTSLMEGSGKGPLSPDTPSSEEVSYESTPKTTDTPKPAVIPECARRRTTQKMGRKESSHRKKGKCLKW